MADLDPPPRLTAFDLFWKQLGRFNLVFGGIGSLIVAILLWRFLPQTPVPLWVVALVGIPLGFAVVSLWVALRDAAQRIAERPTSSVVAVVSPCAPYLHAKCILIVKWSASAALAIGSGVTISIAEQFHERALGIGTVRGVQADGNAQVTVDQPYQGADEMLQQLLDPKRTDLIKQLRLGSQILLQHFPSGPTANLAAPATPDVGDQRSTPSITDTPKGGR